VRRAVLRRLGQQLELVHRRGAWRFDVPRQSEPVSPPPRMTTRCRRHDLVRDRVAGDHLVLLRQELHGEVDAAELAPGHREVARLGRAA